MTTSYEEAVREATDYLAEADLHLARTGRLPSIPLPADLLRALLAGPPEPSEPVAWLVENTMTGVSPVATVDPERAKTFGGRPLYDRPTDEVSMDRIAVCIATHLSLGLGIDLPTMETNKIAQAVQALYRSRRA